MKQYRQGDVFIQRVTKKEHLTTKHVEVPKDRGRVVLAYGEVTGHAHAIHDLGVCLLRREGVSERVLTIGKDGAHLQHEEHGTIALSVGTYVVRIQREYDWLEEASRNVAD